MDSFDLIKWRETYFGLDLVAAARRMGVSSRSLRIWEDGGRRKIPDYVPLLCNAIAHNLGPWELPPELKKLKKKTPDIKPARHRGRPKKAHVENEAA